MSVATPSVGAWTLARLLAQLPADPNSIGPDHPLFGIIQMVVNANGQGPRAAFEDALKGRDDAEQIITLIASIDVNEPAPESATSKAARVPELPTAARPDPRIAADAGHWVDAYVRYAQSVSPMTPPLFHEAAALVLVATAIARRVVMQMSHDDVFPNLYVLQVAVSTLYAKSTGLNIARRLAGRFMPHLLAPQESSPEALLSDMAGREPMHFDKLTTEERVLWSAEQNFCAQRALIVDEGSGLLALCAKDYGSGLTEFLLKLYDCDSRYSRSTRSQGRVTIRNAYFNLLTASTPSAMSPYLGPSKLWTDGLWPRFVLLTPEGGRPPFQRTRPLGPPDVDITDPLVRLIRQLPNQTYPEVARPLPASFDDEALKKWFAYDEALRYTLITDDMDDRVRTSYGRMPTHVLKVAALLASMAWNGKENAPHIQASHMHRAISTVESWRASLHRVIEGGAVAEENIRLARVIRTVSSAGLEGITARDIGRSMRDVPGSEVRKLIDQAENTGEVIAAHRVVGSAGGRPTTLYRIPIE